MAVHKNSRSVAASTWLACLMLPALLLIVGCVHPGADAADSHLADEYAAIRKTIGPKPSEGLTSWGMNCDHLFLAEKYDGSEPGDTLRERCERFTRKQGALDFLFDRLLNCEIQPEDTLADVQIMIFWGMKEDPGDEVIKAHLASEALDAVQSGKFRKWDEAFPDFGVSRYIRIAAAKAK